MNVYMPHGLGARIEETDVLLWNESWETERPPAVPEDWVIYARQLPEVFTNIEEALDAGSVELYSIGEMASEGEPIYPHGIEDVEQPDGIIVIIKYWAPPDESPPSKVGAKKDRTGLIIGVGAVGIALVATAAYVAGRK